MQPFIDELATRGIAGATVALPVRRAEDAVAAYRAQLPATLSGSLIGGHSYGGRVASLLATAERPVGLVLLSYPLHRPGRPDEPRTAHWSRIECPVLLISGEADPFARIELLREQVQLLRDAELVTYAGVRHGVGGTRLAETVRHIGRFVGRLREP